jgi:hypothetical protein
MKKLNKTLELCKCHSTLCSKITYIIPEPLYSYIRTNTLKKSYSFNPILFILLELQSV